MTGDPKLMAGLQEAIHLEASLSLQYLLDARNVKRFGLSIASGLGKLGKQCAGYMKDLVDALLFLDGAPEIAPKAASTHATVGAIQVDAIAAEEAVVARYSSLCREAFDAGEMDVFHLYQHLAKFHKRGGNGNQGHLAWLKKQAWQLKEFGDKDYEEVKA